MKRIILLTIMILFSFKVNSNNDCELPKIQFFETVQEANGSKFSFQPFVEEVLLDLENITGKTQVIGVTFDKSAALGALFKVYDLFVEKIEAKAGSAKIVDFMQEVEFIWPINKNKKAAAIAAYDKNINQDNIKSILKKIGGDEGSKGIVDYFVSVKEESSLWGLGWLVGTTKYFESIDSKLLNETLNYIYLFALSFLIKNDTEMSKFLTCMHDLYFRVLVKSLNIVTGNKKVDSNVFKIFDAIAAETKMHEKIKPESLSLEQSRGALSILTYTLNSLANLNFE